MLAGNALKAVGGSPTLYPKKGHLEYFPKYPMHMAGHADPPVVLALRRPDLYQVLSYLHVRPQCFTYLGIHIDSEVRIG